MAKKERILIEGKAPKDIYFKPIADGEERLLGAMQHHLVANLPTEWDALHPKHSKPTLWEQLLAMPVDIYGLNRNGWKLGMYNSIEAVAAEAVASTYGLGMAMSTEKYPGIRTIAELVGMPYGLLLQVYIDKYGDRNNGKNYLRSRKG